MNDDVDRVRARLNIVDVVSRRVPLKRAGKDYKGVCPFHDDKSPSMHVSPNMGIYKCFACGAGGDAFKFVMEFHRVDFKEALTLLAEEVGIELTPLKSGGAAPSQKASWREAMHTAQRFFMEQFAQSKEAQEYCRERGLDAETVKEWGLGFGSNVDGALAQTLRKAGFALNECEELFLVVQDAGGGYYDRFRGRLTFPIYDEGGRPVAFGGRLLGKGNPKQPKYINSSDTPLYSKRRLLYGMNRAKQHIAKTERVVLVEGYLDVIACHRAGVTQAVASLGTSLSEEHAGLLARWAKEVVILYDADAAGIKAAERATGILEAEGLRVRVALLPEGDDPDTMLARDGAVGVLRAVESTLDPMAFRLGQLRAAVDVSTQEFWDQALEILSQAKRWTEVLGPLDNLASEYPFTKDRQAARRGLERDLRALIASRKKASPTQRSRAAAPIPADPSAVHVCEATIFRAALSPDFFRLAADALQEEDLFFTRTGIQVAEDLKLHWLKGERAAGPVLVAELQETHAFDLLIHLDTHSVLPISLESLRDAWDDLKRRRGDRQRQSLAGQSMDRESLELAREQLKQKSFRPRKIEEEK